MLTQDVNDSPADKAPSFLIYADFPGTYRLPHWLHQAAGSSGHDRRGSISATENGGRESMWAATKLVPQDEFRMELRRHACLLLPIPQRGPHTHCPMFCVGSAAQPDTASYHLRDVPRNVGNGILHALFQPFLDCNILGLGGSGMRSGGLGCPVCFGPAFYGLPLGVQVIL